MVGRSDFSDTLGTGHSNPSPTEVVEGYRNLIEVEPKAASGHLESVEEVAESSQVARVRLVDAVADLIVMLPPAGSRYPAQVLADLVADDAMMVREKAVETVADLATVLGSAHIAQCQSVFAATAQRLDSNDHEFVRERAGAALLTLGLAHDGIGLSYLAMVVSVLTQTLPTKASDAIEYASEQLESVRTPTKAAPMAD